MLQFTYIVFYMLRILSIILVIFVLPAIAPLNITYAQSTGSGMYPRSTYLTNITWDDTKKEITCGDNAATTWADNDFLYGSLGDCQSSFNIVQVNGTLPGVTGTVLNPKVDGKTWPCCGYDGGKQKSAGLLAIGNTIYSLQRNWDGRNGVGLVVSTDGGRNFTFNPQQIKIRLGYPTFANAGKGYAGAPDNYVYIWGHGCEDTAYNGCDRMHMLRVPKDRITDKTAYEYFVRMNGTSALWAATDPGAADLLTKAGTVFRCSGSGKCNRSGITFNAPLGKYIVWMSDWNGEDDFRNPGTGGLGIYESATPWNADSWKMVWHTPTSTGGWGVISGDGIGDAGVFTTKWMSTDGKQMYLAYGGNNKYSLRKATFTVSGSPPTPSFPPKSPTPAGAGCFTRSSGDANCSGAIDGIDFSIWLNSQCHRTASSQICSDTRADFDGDRNVDDTDYMIWVSGEGTPLSSPTPPSNPSPPPSSGHYRVSGNKIITTGGTSHIFRGIDRPSLEWDANGNNLSLADYQKIRSWGANITRLAVNQGFWRADTSGYKARLQQNIAWIKQAGMDAIIDLHWSEAGGTGKGGQQKMPDTKSLTFWADIAGLYKNDPRVLFELYNEPHDISCEVWKNGGTVDGWQAAGMQQISDAIRATGAQNLILIGGLNWAFDLTCVKTHRITGTNIVYSTHPYNFNGKNTAADWDNKVGFLAVTDPVIITEFGDTQQQGAAGSECSDDFNRRIIEWAEGKSIHWTAWAWYPGSCAFPALIKDWNGTPNAAGRVIQEFLKRNT